ncbi:MAG TPA: hypothetical protein VD932_09010 [Aquabacterium sp.]|nr:hypothetical protein [Aquabacterium sp.]
MPDASTADEGPPPSNDRATCDVGVGAEMNRLLEHAADHHRLVLIVRTPKLLSRISLYQALDDHFGRWEPRSPIRACIDLANHPALPAQTVIGSDVQAWDDLAEGLPAALAPVNVLVVLGVEQMLSDTPHRLTAFLEARARHQVVVVLTPHADQVRALPIREAPVHLDCSLARQSNLMLMAKSVAQMALAAARRSARHAAMADPTRRRP